MTIIGVTTARKLRTGGDGSERTRPLFLERLLEEFAKSIQRRQS